MVCREAEKREITIFKAFVKLPEKTIITCSKKYTVESYLRNKKEPIFFKDTFAGQTKK